MHRRKPKHFILREISKCCWQSISAFLLWFSEKIFNLYLLHAGLKMKFPRLSSVVINIRFEFFFFCKLVKDATLFLIWSLQVFCKNSAYHKHFRFNACGSQDSLSKSKDLIVNFQFGLSTFALVDHGMMKNEKYCLHVASIYLVCFSIVIRSL